MFLWQAAKNLDKNTPVIWYLDMGLVPDERYKESKTGTPKIEFLTYLAQTSNFRDMEKILL